jgi:hypothetical protein
MPNRGTNDVLHIVDIQAIWMPRRAGCPPSRNALATRSAYTDQYRQIANDRLTSRLMA